MKGRKTQQPVDEREKESDQIGEATCLEHIKEEPRKKKKNKKQKKKEPGLVGLGRRALRGLAWPGLGCARPGLGSSLSVSFFFFFSLSGFFWIWVLLWPL